MFNFALPVRGEPIDLSMLSKMAEYINYINQKLLEQKSATSSLDAPTRLKLETDNLTIWTGRVLVAQNIQPVTDASKLERINWRADFDVSFKSIPIVTATPFCNSTGGGTISSNSCWLHESTQTYVKGKFKFNESPRQVEDVYVNVIAIGEGVV